MSPSSNDPFDEAISRLNLFREQQREHQVNLQRWWNVLVNDWKNEMIEISNVANQKFADYNFMFRKIEPNNKMGTATQLFIEAVGPFNARTDTRLVHPKLIFQLDGNGEAVITSKTGGTDIIPERRLPFDDSGSKALLAGILAEYAEAMIRRTGV